MHDIEYVEVIRCAGESRETVDAYLRARLPFLWRDAYLSMSRRPSNIVVFTHGSFEYFFDTYQDQEPYDLTTDQAPIEGRLIAAIGRSQPKRTSRDDGRLRGLTVTAMPHVLGPWDRGHFIGHSIGGVVDGNEANVFLQYRSANRGRYRVLEGYCFKNPGVLCFSRPIYADASAHPYSVEFGVLKRDGELWVERIPNRPTISCQLVERLKDRKHA